MIGTSVPISYIIRERDGESQVVVAIEDIILMFSDLEIQVRDETLDPDTIFDRDMFHNFLGAMTKMFTAIRDHALQYEEETDEDILQLDLFDQEVED